MDAGNKSLTIPLSAVSLAVEAAKENRADVALMSLASVTDLSSSFESGDDGFRNITRHALPEFTLQPLSYVPPSSISGDSGSAGGSD